MKAANSRVRAKQKMAQLKRRPELESPLPPLEFFYFSGSRKHSGP
jgi:hypothetical protein